MTDEIQPGANLGKYEILRKLVTGGMAEIYLARVRGTAGFEKLVVLKRILPSVAGDRAFVTMFLDEARLAATLRHANIADVFDVGAENNSYFFAMEYIHGQDARAVRLQARRHHQPIPLEIALAIATGTSAALGYAHSKTGPRGPLGLVHRDVSPSNILISYDGAVKLVDFGIARASSRTAKTQTGLLKGKVPYMSPEQCRGHVLDRRSDLFSFGTVLYELTTGVRPFRGESDFETMELIVNTVVAAPSSVVADYPKGLEAIVMRLLVRDPKKRYQTAEALLEDLERLLAKLEVFTSASVVGKFMRELFADQLTAEPALPSASVAARRWGDPALIHTTPPSRESEPHDATREYPAGAGQPPTQLLEANLPTSQTGYASEPVPSGRYAEPVSIADPELAIATEFRSATVIDAPALESTGTGSRLTYVADPEQLASQPFALRIDDPRLAARTTPQGHPLVPPPRKRATTASPFASETRHDVILPFDPIDARSADILDEVDEGAPSDEPEVERTTRRITTLLERAFAWYEVEDLERAVAAIDLAMSENPTSAIAQKLLRRHRDAIATIFETFLGDPAGQLKLARPLEELANVPISPRAAFLLSRLEGVVSIDDLLDVSGMPRLEAQRYLCQLFLRGVLIVSQV